MKVFKVLVYVCLPKNILTVQNICFQAEALTSHLKFKKGVPIAVYEEFADDKIEN
jgi:hypothetical protein